jgi:hypothetical protein
LLSLAPTIEAVKTEVSTNMPELDDSLATGITEGFLLRRQDLQNYYLERVLGEQGLESFDWNVNIVMSDSNLAMIGKPILLLELAL